MTKYHVHCEVCGDIGKPTTIKQRADAKRGKHAFETGHTVQVDRAKTKEVD